MSTPPTNLTPYGQQLWIAAQRCCAGPQPDGEDSAEDYYKTHAAFKDACRPARMLGMLNTMSAALTNVPVMPPTTREHQTNRITRLETMLQIAHGFLDVLDGHVEFEGIFTKEDMQRLRAIQTESEGIQAAKSTTGMLERAQFSMPDLKEYGGTKVCTRCGHIHTGDCGTAE